MTTDLITWFDGYDRIPSSGIQSGQLTQTVYAVPSAPLHAGEEVAERTRCGRSTSGMQRDPKPWSMWNPESLCQACVDAIKP